MTHTALHIDGLSVDVGGISAFISSCVEEPVALDSVKMLTGGSSNLTLVAQQENRSWVLRRRPLGDIPNQAHDMHREYHTLRLFAGTSIPVPETIGFCDDETLIGAPFYVMDYVEGIVIESARDVEPIPGPVRGPLCAKIVRVLADLHAIPLSEFPAYQPGRGGNVMFRHLQRWHERWRARPHRDLPEIDRIATELGRRLPPMNELAFVHGDYRIGNMIVSPDGRPRPVLAVLDWELSTFGHPLTDLAHLLAYWEGTGETYSHRAQNIASEVGFPDGQHLAEEYASESGRELDFLPVFWAFEHWRAAIIKEAIYQRRVQLNADPELIAETKRGVDSHLDEAAARLAIS